MPRRVTLVAGSGGLVPHVADAILRRGDRLQFIDLSGEREIHGIEVSRFTLSDASAMLEAVKTFGPSHLVLAGGVHISDVDRRGLASAFGLAGRIAGGLGDIGVAGMILLYCRTHGYRLVGAHEVAPELVAPVGLIAGPPADDILTDTARSALRAARAIGAIDLGQSVVVSVNRPVAAEDAGGTDALLERVAQLRAAGLVGNRGGRLVLGKSRKPRQPAFVDLPAIGGDTIVGAAAAGIAAIVVEAGGSLVLERDRLSAEADRLGITVLGMRHG